MAGNTTLGFHWRVFKCKRTGLIGVAVEAECILRIGGPKLARQETSMRVVTVGAANQTFIYLVMEGLGKIRFSFQVAGIAYFGLRGREQLPLYCGVVYRMTIEAAYIVFEVLRT